jgi:hypothetical protein
MDAIKVEEQPRHIVAGEGQRQRGLLAGGSLAEALGGAGAVVLGILGLIGVLPVMMASICAIVIGGALLFGGGTLAARYGRALSRTTSDELAEASAGGLAFEALCGVAGIALGILALLGISQFTLLGVAAIVLGGGLALASGATSRLDDLLQRSGMDASGLRASQEALRATGGAEVMIGLAAVVLGILALSGVAPLILILVAMLGLGVAVLMSGSSIASRLLPMRR